MTEKTKCGAPAGRPHEMDELLEHIWTQKERGKTDRQELLAITPIDKAGHWLSKLAEENLITLIGNEVFMTPRGEKEAEQIIRRHRLAERLFADVFATSEAVWEREACELEHQTVLVTEAVNAVCAFLGHPPTCPHGRPIPRGLCCHTFKKEMAPFVIPLSSAPLAEPYRIVFIAPQSARRLDRLAALGLLPGGELRIRQKRPSYVIRIGETDVALDREVVGDIYVKAARHLQAPE